MRTYTIQESMRTLHLEHPSMDVLHAHQAIGNTITVEERGLLD
jgi:hypothetical protein